MRILFFLLVLANLLFFVWSAGYLSGQEEGREPQRLQNQLNPDKAKVTVAAPPAAAPATPPAAEPVSAAVAPPPPACRRIEGVAAKDGGTLQQALQQAGFTVAVMPLEERSYTVSISGLPNKATADKKVGELKLFGIKDFRVVELEGGGFAISLAVFADEAAATQYLQGLVKKGVKSARIEAHGKPPTALRLELRGPADLVAKRLPSLLAAVPGASAVECP